MERVLALDQSSKVSGYAIFEDGELIEKGKLSFSQSDVIVRIINLQNAIELMIDEKEIDKVILEDIQKQSSVTTFKILAFVLGALEILCKRKKIPYQVIGASSWKSACGVKGRARAEQKTNAKKFVSETFGEGVSEDEADAICIGYAVLNKKSAW